MADFPDNIACTINKGYSEQMPFRRRYLGNKTFVPKVTVQVTARINNHDDMNDFMVWYRNTADYGYDSFTIDLPLLGPVATWTVRFAEQPNTTYLDKGQARDLPMKLEVLDTV